MPWLLLIKAVQPRYHVFGHLHQMIGPVRVGDTVCIEPDQLVAPVRDESLQIICLGSLGVLDMARDAFCFVQDDWLVEFGRQASIEDLSDRVIGVE